VRDDDLCGSGWEGKSRMTRVCDNTKEGRSVGMSRVYCALNQSLPRKDATYKRH
jgi:hypothetical protein